MRVHVRYFIQLVILNVLSFHILLPSEAGLVVLQMAWESPHAIGRCLCKTQHAPTGW